MVYFLKKINKYIFFAIVILIIIQLFSLYKTIYTIPHNYEPDEVPHIQDAFYYNLFFVEKDVFSEEWSNPAFFDQPPVAKYIIGFFLHLYNDTLITNSNGLKEWHKSVLDRFWIQDLYKKLNDTDSIDEKQKLSSLIQYGEYFSDAVSVKNLGEYITDRDYIISRLVVFWFEILSLISLIYLIFYSTKNRLIAVIVGFLFIKSPITMPVFQAAMTDSLWYFFVLLSILFLIRMFESYTFKKYKMFLIYSIVLGLALSLAFGTKFIVIYMLASLFILYMYQIILLYYSKISHQNLPQISLFIKGFLIFATSFLFFFVILNPFLYKHPVSNFMKMIEHRQIIMEIQREVYPAEHIKTIYERFAIIFNKGMLSGYTYDTFLAKTFVGILLIAMFTGIISMFQYTFFEFKNRVVGISTILSVISVVTFACIGVMVHTHWGRYFLPMSMLSLIWVGLGLNVLYKKIVSKYP